MSSIFSGILSGWIRENEWDNVQSSYGDQFCLAEVTRNRNDNRSERIWCLKNRVTKDFYLPDSTTLVAAKCFFISLGAPLYTAGRFLFHIGRSFYLTYRIFERSIQNFRDDLDAGTNRWEAFRDRIIVQLSSALFMEAFLGQALECIKAPYYGLGLFIAAIEGFIHDPYKAKTEIALIERHWNGDRNGYQACHFQSSHNTNLWRAIMLSEAFFLAPCMQPIGNEDEMIARGNAIVNRYVDIQENPIEAISCPPLIPYPCPC
jgi:hypothetical protein